MSIFIERIDKLSLISNYSIDSTGTIAFWNFQGFNGIDLSIFPQDIPDIEIEIPDNYLPRSDSVIINAYDDNMAIP